MKIRIFFRSRPQRLRGSYILFELEARPKRTLFACVILAEFRVMCVRCNFEPAEAKFRLFYQQLGDENPNFTPARLRCSRGSCKLLNWELAQKSPFCVLDFGGVLLNVRAFGVVLSPQRPNFGCFIIILVIKVRILFPLAPSALAWLLYTF